MAFFRGIVGKIVAVALVVVVLVVIFGIVLYSSDYAVEATVTDTRCGMDEDLVFVKTKVGGFTDKTPVTHQECLLIRIGNFVEYHIRSQRTVIYEKENGRCIYDTSQVACRTPALST